MSRQVTPVAGGLPAHAAGVWAPLPLFNRPPEEKTGELPVAPLAVDEAEAPDRAAIAREITALLRSKKTSQRLVQLAKQWAGDPALKRLLVAALRTDGRPWRANELGGPPRAVPVQVNELAPTPGLTMATEVPDEFDGLTATQRHVLKALRMAAPPGRPFVRLSELAAEAAFALENKGGLPVVERALISLGHPSLRRLPLVEFQGFSGRFSPGNEHFTHARLTRDGLDVLEEKFPLPLILINGAEGRGACIPPHSPLEIAKACLLLLSDRNTRSWEVTNRLEGPDLPDGGLLLQEGVGTLWNIGLSTLTSRAKFALETDESGNARVVISELPWPMNGATVSAALRGLQGQGWLDGARIVDHSSATSSRVVLELEHLAFSGPVRNEILASRACQLRWAAELRVGGTSPHRVDLIDLLQAFIEHRKEVAVKRLDRAVAEARLRAQAAEAVYVAVVFREEVLSVMRAAYEDEEAIHGLMNFMGPSHRMALSTALPFPPSHPYMKGFTEHQARHLMTVRKLASRTEDLARHDWAHAISAIADSSALLSDRHAILEVVRKELQGAIERFDGPRRTEILRW